MMRRVPSDVNDETQQRRSPLQNCPWLLSWTHIRPHFQLHHVGHMGQSLIPTPLRHTHTHWSLRDLCSHWPPLDTKIICVFVVSGHAIPSALPWGQEAPPPPSTFLVLGKLGLANGDPSPACVLQVNWAKPNQSQTTRIKPQPTSRSVNKKNKHVLF